MKDVAKRATELFSEKQGKHDYYKAGKPGGMICRKGCGILFGARKNISCLPDPIDITDLGKALECLRSLGEPSLLLMDKCNAEKFYPYMDWVIKLTASHFKTWLLYEATAEQIWEICILAKESEK